MDEISLLGKTKILELKDGMLKSYEISPEDFGMKRCTLQDIQTGTPEENASTIRGVFSGKITGPQKDAVVLNSAGALIVGGKAEDFESGIDLARHIIESGKAMEKLEKLIAHSNAFLN